MFRAKKIGKQWRNYKCNNK